MHDPRGTDLANTDELYSFWNYDNVFCFGLWSHRGKWKKEDRSSCRLTPFFSVRCIGLFFNKIHVYGVISGCTLIIWKKRFFLTCNFWQISSSEWINEMKGEIYYPYTWCTMQFHNSPMLVKKDRPDVFTFKKFVQCFLVLPWAWDL